MVGEDAGSRTQRAAVLKGSRPCSWTPGHTPLTSRFPLQSTRWTASLFVPVSCGGKGPSGSGRTTSPSARRTAASSRSRQPRARAGPSRPSQTPHSPLPGAVPFAAPSAEMWPCHREVPASRSPRLINTGESHPVPHPRFTSARTKGIPCSVPTLLTKGAKDGPVRAWVAAFLSCPLEESEVGEQKLDPRSRAESTAGLHAAVSPAGSLERAFSCLL